MTTTIKNKTYRRIIVTHYQDYNIHMKKVHHQDLLFHIQEHRFTIPQISKALNELGLAFAGFEFNYTKKTIDTFKKAYPKEGAIYDLDNWYEYEISNPLLFARMYQFWAQKS